MSYPSWGLSVRSMPRWSTAMTVKFLASAGISRRQAYQVSGQPCTSSSAGPSPPMTTCWRRPLAWTNRLLKVLVNPGGRFGASETLRPFTLPPAGHPQRGHLSLIGTAVELDRLLDARA